MKVAIPDAVRMLFWPALTILGILALPYLFRAVFFLERVLGAQP
jgi:hypothetical protein